MITPSQLTIIVRPSVRGKAHPLTAYIAGTTLEGCGPTVERAILDLLSDGRVGKLCAALESAVERMGKP